jgi:uncharacterized protein YndB with AHSA1/START domain
VTARSIEHASFTIERRYDVSPNRVFAAWSDPAAKARWFGGPEEWQAGRYELDFREGGIEVSSGGPEGGPVHHYRAVYWEVVPDERIVYTYELLLGDVRISVSLVTLELKPEGAGTRLTLTEYAAFFDDLEDPAQRRDGTGSLLDALGRELS